MSSESGEDGTSVSASPKKPISYYVRSGLTRHCFVTVSAVIGIVIAGAFFASRGSSSRIAVAQARIVGAAITPSAKGDLAESVARMRRACKDVIAVATVGSAGELFAIYPNRAGHRASMGAAVEQLRDGLHLSLNESVSVKSTMASPTHSVGSRLSAVAVPVGGTDGPGARCIVVLLAEPTGVNPLYLASGLLGPIVLVLVLGSASLHQRLDHTICRPVRLLCKAMDGPASPEGRRQRRAAGACEELAVIASHFDKILNTETQAHARFERLRIHTDERLKNQEAGLDRQLRRAEDKALTDPLTQLRNRAYLESSLDQIFAGQRDNDLDLCAIMLDLDNFKQLNDRYGHQAGDAMIEFAGSLLSGSLRQGDVAIRYGGDEFLVLLPSMDEHQGASVIDRIVKLFGQYARQYGDEPFVTMSAGIASLKLGMPTSGQDLIDKADRALYKVKNAGKNAVGMFSAA